MSTSIEDLRARSEAGIEALRLRLDAELKQLREQLQAETRSNFLSALNDLQRLIDKSGADAKKMYEERMAQAAEMRKKTLRPAIVEKMEQSALHYYESTLEFHQKLLDQFVQTCSPS